MTPIPRVVIPGNPARIDPATARLVVSGLHNPGFVLVHAPHIESIAAAAYRRGETFFSQPEEKKMESHRPDAAGERGFSPLRDEQGLLCKDIGPDGTPVADCKEFFALGKSPWTLPLRYQRFRFGRWKSLYKPNTWPRIPGFKKELWTLYDSLSEVGTRVLRAVAIALELPWNYFDKIMRNGADMMRLLHYPPLSQEEIRQVTVWGCAHRDLSFVTILARGVYLGANTPDPESGLWIKPRGVRFEDKSLWVRGIAPEEYVFVQGGNLLKRFTSGLPMKHRLLSAWHEVRAPSTPTTGGRMSAALFKHIRPDIPVRGMTAGDYVLRELEKIGLANQR